MTTTSPEIELFRGAMRQLAAGVTIITASDEQTATGLTATAVCSLSADPPRILACINSGGETCRVIDASRRMCINILSSHDEAHARNFAGMTQLHGTDRFDSDWSFDETGLPRLETALAHLICDVSMVVNLGSHGITVGDIAGIWLSASPGSPLLYADAGFAELMPKPLAA